MPSYKPLFGYEAQPLKTAQFVSTLRHPTIETSLPHLLSTNGDQREVFMLADIVAVDPNWERGAQAIGDCVSWGYTHAGDSIVAGMCRRGEAAWRETWFSQPAFYGLRCDLDRQFCNNQDGWYGSGASEASVKYGFVPAEDWSQVTRNSAHDLRKYDGRKAKEFGRSGLDEALEKIASERSVKEVVLIETLEAAEAAIDRGCPLPICSDVGFGSMKRDSTGIVRASGSWAHCMCVNGKIWHNSQRLWRNVQSWGDSCSGPDPLVEPLVKRMVQNMAGPRGWSATEVRDIVGRGVDWISKCSWWIVDQDMLRILRQGDTYALSGVEGLEQPLYDFESDWLV